MRRINVQDDDIMNKKISRVLTGGIIVAVIFWIVNIYAYGKVSEDKHSEQLDLGYKYLSEMKYEQAEVVFEEVIRLDGRNYEAYLGLAEVYTSMDEIDMAEEIMQEAAEKCGYGEVQIKAIEAQAGLRRFRNKAMENSDLGVVSGLTDFCVQGLDLILAWIERASTILDGITLVWTDLQKNISNYVSK